MNKYFWTIAVLISMCAGAWAQTTYDIKQMTPEVKSALDARKARFGELKALKAAGKVGENNRGYVETLGGGKDTTAIVDAENANRKLIYQVIVDQNGLGRDALATVEKVFGDVQRNKAASGDKIQNSDGKWMKK